jgi:hypothetical protein
MWKMCLLSLPSYSRHILELTFKAYISAWNRGRLVPSFEMSDRRPIYSHTCLAIFSRAVRIINNCFLFEGNIVPILAFWDHNFEGDSEIISQKANTDNLVELKSFWNSRHYLHLLRKRKIPSIIRKSSPVGDDNLCTIQERISQWHAF